MNPRGKASDCVGCKQVPGAAILFAFSINSAANEVVDMVIEAILQLVSVSMKRGYSTG